MLPTARSQAASSGSTVYDLHRLFHDEPNCLQHLIHSGVFYQSIICDGCGDPMIMKVDRRVFRCSRRGCETLSSIRSFTFFYGSQLPCSKILFLGYLWIHRAPWTTAFGMTGHSERTVTSFYGHFRRLVSSTLLEEDTIIGGPGVEVEVDESKLGKRKYHRGHRVEGVWVVCGVERMPSRKLFLVEVQDRSASTLISLISSHVLPGSIILTDMWRGYSSITEELGMVHRTVNHSVTFKNPIDGTCTNTVEGTNNGLKIRIVPRNRVRDGIDEHLMEYVWRRKHEGHLWVAFMQALRDIHYVFE
jgi:hypothetical protein